jgi:DNA-binding CsgD family transcriptional regulator/5-methylcytosine-specific restriction endonuclease McrA
MEDAKRRQLKELLEAGVQRASIARRLSVSPSTVTRHARLLGFPDAAPSRSETDWRAVQEFYDAGHTITECRERFGFGCGSWDKAVVRGEVKVRARQNGELRGGTRDRVEDLIARGFSQAEAARELGLSKSTVAYHARRLGIRADPRFARRHDWNAVQRAIDEEGLSMTQCLKRFGFFRDTWYRAVRRGDIVPRPHVIPLDELLVVGRRTNRNHLKGRMIRAGLKENRCEICGITDWLGKPLSMELHHINGDGKDNRLENLQLLCGNCHAQTDNWGGRGALRRRGAVR